MHLMTCLTIIDYESLMVVRKKIKIVKKMLMSWFLSKWQLWLATLNTFLILSPALIFLFKCFDGKIFERYLRYSCTSISSLSDSLSQLSSLSEFSIFFLFLLIVQLTMTSFMLIYFTNKNRTLLLEIILAFNEIAHKTLLKGVTPACPDQL